MCLFEGRSPAANFVAPARPSLVSLLQQLSSQNNVPSGNHLSKAVQPEVPSLAAGLLHPKLGPPGTK